MITYTSIGLIETGKRASYHEATQTSKLFCLAIQTLAILLVALALLWAFGVLTVFEDGSWAIGSFPYPLSGCLPWGLCNVGG